MRKAEAPRVTAPIGMDDESAAAHLSISRSHFRKLVNEGVMPRPRKLGKLRIWDREQLEQWFRELPVDGDQAPADDVAFIDPFGSAA